MEDKVLYRLKEREKELNCLYRIEEILKDENSGILSICRRIIAQIPPAWQYPSICMVKINYLEETVQTTDFVKTEWSQKADIVVDNKVYGSIMVYYSQFIRNHKSGSQFLPEEQKLLNTIAARLSDFIFYKKLKETIKFLHTPNIQINSDNMLLGITDEHWKWRYKFMEEIASKCDFNKYGIEAIYIIGSTKNAEAGPASDIDLMIHTNGNDNQKELLKSWIEGWGLCLDELNFMKTGFKSGQSLIDLHIITDEDIEQKTSFAVMIGSPFNSAKLLRKIKKP